MSYQDYPQLTDSERRAQKDAARARAQKIAEAKAVKEAAKAAAKAPKSSKKAEKAKRKRAEPKSDSEGEEEGSDDEDDEAARLRRRMDAAMAAGSGDSEMESDGDDESGLESADEDEDDYDDAELDDEDMEDGESFHTASEDEDEDDEGDEEDDGAESDESETLRDGPLTAKEIQMRAQMDAIFAAMNKAEGIVPPKPKADKKGKGKDVASEPEKKPKKKTGPLTEEDENALYDLSAGVPLSAAALEEAEAELQSKKKKAAGKQEQEKRNAAAAKKRGNKRKRRKTDTVEKDLGGSTLHLLQPVLSAGDGLPPVIEVGSQQKRASAKSRFMKNAMKESGRIPGKAILDGRRRR